MRSLKPRTGSTAKRARRSSRWAQAVPARGPGALRASSTQSWYVFCIRPNDSQLLNQLEGRSIKGQVRSAGLNTVAQQSRCVFEVSMTPQEFLERYRDSLGDSPYAPYLTLGPEVRTQTPYDGGFDDPSNQSNQLLTLVQNASSFQRANLYNDEYEERKSFRSDDFDEQSLLTSQHDDTSNFATESHAPPRNMFQDADAKGGWARRRSVAISRRARRRR
jgi:hypothetical protein